MKPCPSRDELRRFSDGQMGEPECAVIAGHVDDCPLCQKALENLTADHQVQGWRLLLGEEHPAPGFEPPPGFLKNLKDNGPPFEQPTPKPDGDTETGTIRFPGPPTPRGPLGQLESY